MLFNLHAIDLLLLLILAATAVIGWRLGFTVVTLGYAGLLVGLALGSWAAARVGLFISAEDSLRRLLFGIGFPVEQHLVVTNAHVVAGTGRHRVITTDGSRAIATVVWFDPRRDLALLNVPGISLDPLRLAGAVPTGTTGAVIGYPGGGSEKVVGARVVARTTAVGRDIYSSSLARREIYVLRARVRKGDSGGPVVDRSGRPIGVVFAASTVDPQEGYALTNSELRTVLTQVGSRRAPVGVGECAA